MSNVRIVTPPSNTVKVVARGATGLSAYEVALTTGFTGTEEEWLQSISNGGLAVSTVEGNRLFIEPGGLFVPSFVHVQMVAVKVWTIDHNLDCYPAAVLVDTNGDRIYGDENHPSTNRMTVTFKTILSGTARLI